MPRLSEFYGIVIAMYYEDHDPPHFHVVYAGNRASVRWNPFGVQRGTLPTRALNLVREWATQHGDELMENWQRARQGLPLQPIPPLV